MKLNVHLPYDLTIPLLGIYPSAMTTQVHTKTCTQMLIASLFISARTWKQLKCPSVGEWINKLWYIHTAQQYSSEYYLAINQAIERNKPLKYTTTWMNLKGIMLSERRQSQKVTVYNSIYVIFSERQNYSNQWLPGVIRARGLCDSKGAVWGSFLGMM